MFTHVKLAKCHPKLVILVLKDWRRLIPSKHAGLCRESNCSLTQLQTEAKTEAKTLTESLTMLGQPSKCWRAKERVTPEPRNGAVPRSTRQP